MKNVLLIQLFRSDAVLQSTPALAALRKARPGARIHVLTRRPFGDALRGNSDADEVIEWDFGAPRLPPGGTENPATARRLSELRESLRPLRERRFDAIFNLSNDAMGALVARLLKPRESAGLALCCDRNYRVQNSTSAAAAGDWLRLLCASRETESLRLFNLADIFARACGGTETSSLRIAVSPADERYAEEIAGRCGPGNADRRIAIHPGVLDDPAAPDEENDARWPAPHWVALAAALRASWLIRLFPCVEVMFELISANTSDVAKKRPPSTMVARVMKSVAPRPPKTVWAEPPKAPPASPPPLPDCMSTTPTRARQTSRWKKIRKTYMASSGTGFSRGA